MQRFAFQTAGSGFVEPVETRSSLPEKGLQYGLGLGNLNMTCMNVERRIDLVYRTCNT